MKGTIIGDIVGSVYECKKAHSRDFQLFKSKCLITDDTVLTAAVADALIFCRNSGISDDEGVLTVLTESLRRWGRKYINAGYSNRFRAWLTGENPRPYGASSNGALMRCAPAGWLAESIEDARRLGRLTALPSHDHPEAVSAASMLCELIFRARAGASKDELLEIIRAEYEIPSIEEIRPTCRFDMSCRGTLPVCFALFYEGRDFEDILRTAIFLGGDTDTNAAIACSLEEAWRGVPAELWESARTYCDESILSVVSAFYDIV